MAAGKRVGAMGGVEVVRGEARVCGMARRRCGKAEHVVGVHDGSGLWLGGIPAVLWGHACEHDKWQWDGGGSSSGMGRAVAAGWRGQQWQAGEGGSSRKERVVAAGKRGWRRQEGEGGGSRKE